MKRVLTMLVAVALCAPAAPSSVAAGRTYSEAYIPSTDGVKLFAEVHRPAKAGRVPVVLMLSPYNNGTSTSVYDRQPGKLAYAPFETLLARGYAIVQVSLRGYSSSTGCGDWGGKGEQADAKAAVEWAAAQPWSTGKVGMYGISYDGWTQIMALASKPKGLAAVVPEAPLVSGYMAYWMNGSHYFGGWWNTPTLGYTVLDLKPPTQAHGTDGMANALTGTATNPQCYANNLANVYNGDPSIPYWRERDIIAKAAESTVPVLYSQGFRDAAVKGDNFTALYPRLKGPKRVWVGQFTHRAPDHPDFETVRAQWYREVVEWFDAYVKGDKAALRRVKARPVAVVQEADGRWRNEAQWPPADARATTFGLRNGTYFEDPRDDGTQPTDPGDVHWSVSQRLPYAVHLAGAPRVALTAKGSNPAQVVVKVYDVDPAGKARLVTRGVHANVSGPISFQLYPQDWRFQPGHRIAVAVQGSDTQWSYPWSMFNYNGPTNFRPATGLTVAVSSASLSTPVLRRERSAFVWNVRRSWDPDLTLAPDTIKAAETRFALPPRMTR